MRSIMAGVVLVGLCVATTACKKQEREAPAPAPAGEAGLPPVPVEPPPAVDGGAPPVPEDVTLPPPPPEDAALPPATDAAPADVVDAGPAPDTAPAAPPDEEFITETGSADGLGVDSIALCSAIEERMCVGEKRQFAPGEMVWALLRLTNGTRAETEIRVSYLEAALSPAPGQGLSLRVPAQERYTTFSKAAKQADGRYDVIVTTPTGAEIARARFQVGTGVDATPPEPAPGELLPAGPEPPPPNTITGDLPPGATLGTGLGVASLELCRGIESRRCVEPATTFAPRELVWALLRVTNPDRVETELRVSYLAAGGAPAPEEGLPLHVPAQERYTTFSKAGKAAPGRYEVVICAPDGRELARSGFEVR